ncbi:MAG TPA: GNAT family N-acetyltransferase [Solirubrobacteraceae bacterium]|nr:GNAT family N-acetyltransferase [Solirubrobacteraceae bacterium]
MNEPLIRLMTDADVPAAGTVSADAFDFDISDPITRERWHGRLRHLLRTDPGGSFVAARDGQIAGVAQAMLRDGVWILSLLTVSPTAGRGGEGRALVNASLRYGPDSGPGLIVASNDPRALRIYGSSDGFRLEPAFQAAGAVDAAQIPELHPDITRVSADQLDSLGAISRAVRGASHARDLVVELDRGGAIFRLADRGFVVVGPGRGVRGLAARDEQAAQALLWYGLHTRRHDQEVEVGWITARQQWALPVLLAARLSLRAYGAIAIRGNPGPMHPYLPSPPFA